MTQRSQDFLFSLPLGSNCKSFYFNSLSDVCSLDPNLESCFVSRFRSSLNSGESIGFKVGDLPFPIISKTQSIPTAKIQVSHRDLTLLGAAYSPIWEKQNLSTLVTETAKDFFTGELIPSGISSKWNSYVYDLPANSKIEAFIEAASGRYRKQLAAVETLTGSQQIDLQADGFHRLNAFLNKQEKANLSPVLSSVSSTNRGFQSEYDVGFRNGFLEGYKFALEAQLDRSQPESEYTVNITQIIQVMSTINQYGFGDNISGDKVMGDKINAQINNSQDLVQAAKDIKALLDQLSLEYPNDSPRILAAKAVDQVERNPEIKSRILRGVKVGSLAALEKMIDHPVAKFFTEGAKEILKP